MVTGASKEHSIKAAESTRKNEDLVDLVGIEPYQIIDNTQVIDFTYPQNA